MRGVARRASLGAGNENAYGKWYRSVVASVGASDGREGEVGHEELRHDDSSKGAHGHVTSPVRYGSKLEGAAYALGHCVRCEVGRPNLNADRDGVVPSTRDEEPQVGRNEQKYAVVGAARVGPAVVELVLVAEAFGPVRPRANAGLYLHAVHAPGRVSAPEIVPRNVYVGRA